MNNSYSIRNVSSWLSVAWLRKLRGPLCSIEVRVNNNTIETKSGSVCSLILRKYGLINRIPYENILSVDLKESQKIELIFNEDEYVERKLNLYTESAGELASLITRKMETAIVF